MRVSLPKQRHANWQQGINISFLLPIFILLTSVIALFAVSTPTQAVTSNTLNFQGRLLTNTGALVPDGSYNIEFKLYNAATIDGGESLVQGACQTLPGPIADEDCLWVESRSGGNTVTVQNGYFSVYLGSVTAFPGTINWDQELWLGMNIGGSGAPAWDGEMTPRFKLTAVPYAFRAGALVDASGNAKDADDFAQLAPSSIQTVNAAIAALRLNQTGTGALLQLQGDGSDVFLVDKTGSTVLGAGITVGNSSSTTAGTIRWSGTDLEVYDGASWLSLTSGGGGGGGAANTSMTLVSGHTNLAANTTVQLGVLNQTSATAVSWTVGTNAGFVAPADGSFRACMMNNNAAVTGGEARVRWRVNGVSVGGAACSMTTANPRFGASTIDPGVVTFSVGDTISIAIESVGLTPATTEYTIYWTVEYESTAVSSYFADGGNSFGGTAVLGTTDAFGLNIITNGVTRMSIASTGEATLANSLTVSSGGINLTGGLDNNNGGITEVGSLSDVSSISGVSGTLVLGSGTLQRSASGSTVIDLIDAGAGTTLSILNSDGTQVAGLNVEGTISGANFSGNGSGLTSLDGSNISTGTIADARLSSNVALLNANQTFTALKTFDDGLILGNSTSTTSGAIRWSGTDFEGYDGLQWVSLTGGGGGGGGSPVAATFYDATGGATIAAGVFSTINLDTTLTNSDNTLVSLASNEVTVAEDGFYEITYQVTARLASGTRSGFNAKLQLDTGSGYVDVSGSQAYHYGRIITETSGTSSAATSLELSAGDKIRIQGQGTTQSFTTIADATSLSIARVTNTVGGGGGGTSFNQGGNSFGTTGIVGTLDPFDLNLAAGGVTVLSLSQSTSSATFTGEIVANGGLTIGNASGDPFSIVSNSVTITNGLNFDSNTFVIDSANNFVGLGTASAGNKLSLNTASSADSLAQALISTDGAANKGLVIQGVTSQSGNLLELQNNTGTTLAGFNSSGSLVLGQSTINSLATVARTVSLPDESGTICLSSSATCGFLPYATGSFVTDATTNDTIAINKTGATGNLVALQKNGGAVFTVANTGSLQIQSTDSTALDIRNVGGTSYFSVDTATGTVRVGASTADANGVLFVLDSKNTVGDPTGVNGAQYYNSNDEKFRCFQNGLWQDCITAGNIQYNFIGGLETWTNMPAADTEFLSTEVRQLVDLTTAREFRFNIVRAAGTVTAGADCRVQYATTYAGTYTNLDGATGPEVDVSGTAELKTSGWVTIDLAARADVYVRILCKQGNGVNDPQFRSAAIQIR